MPASERIAHSRIERSARIFFLAALFTVPFSTWLTNILLGMLLFATLGAYVETRAWRDFTLAWPGRLALALLALLALATTWSIAPPGEAAMALKKYLKLLLLPIGIYLCQRDARLAPKAIGSFFAGATVLAISSYLVYFGHMPTSKYDWWRIGDAQDAFSFKNHITIGILLSFAAAASLLQASHAQLAATRLAWAGGAILFSIPVVFLTQGRTGYLAMFLGLVTLFVLRVRMTPMRALGGVLAIATLAAGFYHTSDNVKLRTDALIGELRHQDPRSPNGQRINYFRVGLAAVAEHPLTGTGTGSFAALYEPVARTVWSDRYERHQPHSEFLNLTLQGGLPALALFCALLLTLAAPARRARGMERDTLILLLVIFSSCAMFNSLLWDPTEATWFMLLAGALYAATRRQSI